MLGLVLDIVRRYTFSGGQQRFTRFVALASMLGMVIGVTSLITVLSVMNGFSRELHERILSVIPHAKVTAHDGQIADWQALSATLVTAPGVKAATPYLASTVLLRAGNRTRGATLSGITAQADGAFADLDARITDGDWSALDTSPFGVVLGRSLARLLGIGVGDQIEVVVPVLSVTPLGTFPRRRQLTVVGEFVVGADPDANQAFVSLDTAQRLFGRRGADGLQLHFNDMMLAGEYAQSVAVLIGDEYDIVDWSQTEASLFSAVRMEKMTVAILLLSVIAVAAFNIVATLTMSVTEKRSDIAVLRVLGLSARSILLLFIAYGLTLGLVGIALGGVLGVSLALHINDLVALFEGWFGFQLFDPSVYYIGALPSELRVNDVLWTLGAALMLSLLATLYPAFRASRIPAAEALRRD